MLNTLRKLEQGLKRRVHTAVQDILLTRPSPLFSPIFSLAADEEVHAATAVQHLSRDGAYIAGVRVVPEVLASFRAALADAFDGRRPDLQVKLDARTGNALILNPLRVHPAFLHLASDPFLCGVVERYLRRRIVLADVDIRRVPPFRMDELDQRASTKAVGYTSSHWHRDIRGRQIKVMFYLTDVGAEDSSFAYLSGTHRGRYLRPTRVESSRFSDTWVESCGTAPTECYGAAGTAMIFDTNVIHRLRRRPTARVRDSVTFYYTPGQEARFLDFDPRLVAELPASAQGLYKDKGRPSRPGATA